jgi:hypothetical protein
MIIYLAIGAAILWFLVGMGRGRTVFKRREWRLISGVFSVATLVAAAYVGARGGWEISVVLVLMGLWLASSARINPRAPAAPAPPSNAMSLAEARSILGVEPDATPKEIRTAYTRLMRMAHPDKGGTTGLAVKLNAARDTLLSE